MFSPRIVNLVAPACTALALATALFPAPALAAVTEVLSYALSPSTQLGSRSDEVAISGDGPGCGEVRASASDHATTTTLNSRMHWGGAASEVHPTSPLSEAK